MRTFVVPLYVLPRGGARALLRRVAAVEGVLAAGLDEALVLRVFATDGARRGDVVDALAEWSLARRSR